MLDKIVIKGAKEHNLKNISLEIPRDKLIVFTGLSGSGKTSLAFDTIYAEGQRRYVESLSAYARQFLGIMEKPDVEYIEGLSPAISIDQKTTSKNPRSTVGTITEIYDYLRLLYARVGIPYCPICGKKIRKQTVDEIVEQIMEFPIGKKLFIMAPVIRGKKGEHTKLLETAIKDGFVRARVDGEIIDLAEELPKIEKNDKHNIEIIVDRLVVGEGIRQRLTESVELALSQANNLVMISTPEREDYIFSQNYACPDCGISIDELNPRMFSFNSPFGACPDCTGLGELLKIDIEKIMPNKEKKLNDYGAIQGWSGGGSIIDTISGMYIKGLCEHYKIKPTTKLKDLPEDFMQILLYGSKGEKIKFQHITKTLVRDFEAEFEGVVNTLERRFTQTSSQGMKTYYEQFMSTTLCPTCKGARLKKEMLSVKIGTLNIHELCNKNILAIKDYVNDIYENKMSEKNKMIAEQIVKELNSRLQFLIDVGLNYLTLSRSSGTLSGGEAQRIRLATQIGSGLTGVLYILDEPSIGLHQKDNAKLLASLKKMRDLGNTLIVVEHDEDTMNESDYIVDIGPGAGVHGGNVVFAGTVEDMKKDENSLTGKYLSGRIKIEVPKKRRKIENGYIEIKGAREHNLKNINVKFPVGVFTCVTGVSGSGKSTLVNEILSKAISKELNGARAKPGLHTKITGMEKIDKIINIDQSPIGRTPRSNPATYTGMFDPIRDLFAATADSKMRGYSKGRFSFNIPGGRCEACNGDGIIKIEMHFLPDVYIPCEVCRGHRYSKETLEVKYKGKNISEILDMTIEEALEFFKNIPTIKNKVQTLFDVGLGYIKLGQPSTTLSGGEAQRIKLATELSKRATGKTLYILDEPTTGLHMADVHNLIHIINRLTDSGNTVIIIEHNLDIIKSADYIIDLGPDGGDMGGSLVVSGTPEIVAKCKESYTGEFLKKLL
ncbi:MAG: excinuclease ABC subunit UvrA [Clostridia bacterium]